MEQLRNPGWQTHAKQLRYQLSHLLPLLLLVYIPILLVLAGIMVTYVVKGIPPRLFFIDPVAEFNSPMYIGFLSNFGVLLWGAAASVCLFGGWLAWNCPRQRETSLFLSGAGLISAMLMLDDLYLLHEEVIEDHLHISQKFVFATYGVMVSALLIRFRELILRSDFLLLGLAFVFFSASVAIDLFVTPEEFDVFGFPGRHILEDGVKLLGIATWSLYLIRTSVQLVTPLVSAKS